MRAVRQWSFDVVGLKRLQFTHSTQNQASCRVAQKAGFALEGTFIGVGLSGLVEFTVDAVLLRLLCAMTAAAMLALHLHLVRRNALTPAALGFTRPEPRMSHLLWQIPVAIISCAIVQGLFLGLLTLAGFDVASAQSTNDPLADLKTLSVHLVLVGFAHLFALGVALALLRRFHRNLWDPILLHAVNNALVTLNILITI